MIKADKNSFMLRRASYNLPKFEPPQVKGLYPRTRLFEQLDRISGRGILWITAPPGTGKTSLVASYLAEKSVPAIWYQVDAADNDVASFFHYMALCIKKSYPRQSGILPDFTSEYREGLPAFSINYFRKFFAMVEPGAVLVMDNYQDVGEHSRLHEVLPYLIEEIPAGVRCIICSRHDPPAEMAKIQSARHFSTLCVDSLLLKRHECDALARLYSEKKLNKAQLSKLFDLTQGWTVGVVLTLSHLRVDPKFLDHGEFNNRNALFNYVAKQIFEKLDSGSQSVLLRTAFIQRISIGLAQKLTGEPNVKRILRNLAETNFLTLQHNRIEGSFEYHPLFKEFLMSKAADCYSAAQLQRLKTEVGELLLQQKQFVEAANQFLESANWAKLSIVIKESAKKLLQEGRYQTLTEWLNAIPTYWVDGDIWLQYWRANCELQVNPVSARTQIANVHNEAVKKENIELVYLSYCNYIESFLQVYDTFAPLPSWIERFSALQKKFPSIPTFELRERLNVALFGAMNICWQDHPEFPKRLKKLEKTFALIPNKNIGGFLGAMLAAHYIMVGNRRKLFRVVRYLESILESGKISGLVQLIIMNPLVMVNINEGNTSKQKYYINKGLAHGTSSGLNFLNRYFLAHAVNMHLAKNNEKEAFAIHRKIEQIGYSVEETFYGYVLIALGRTALLRKEFDKAIEFFSEAIKNAKEHRFSFGEGIAKLFLAIAFCMSGKITKANQCIQQVQASTRMAHDNYYNQFPSDMITVYMYLQQKRYLEADELLTKTLAEASKRKLYSSGFWYSPLYQTLICRALEKGIELEYAKTFIRFNQLNPPPRKTINQKLLAQWPWPVRIQCLGDFQVQVFDKYIDGGGKPFQLLKVLLAHGGRSVPKTKMLDALWPDSEGDQAEASLKTTLSRLRQAFGGLDVLQLSNFKLSLNPAICSIDLWEFEEAVQHLISLKDESNLNRLRAAIEQLIRAYPDHLLVDETSSWVMQPRLQLKTKWQRALSIVLPKLEQIDPEQSIQYYQHIIETDAFLEYAHQGLIRCYQSLGRALDARVAYQQCEELLNAKGHRPSPETLQLLEVTRH